MWDEHADRYDEWHETFKGAVENHVDWELLKRRPPRNRHAKILDAAGGTGRITLPLAKMGYSVARATSKGSAPRAGPLIFSASLSAVTIDYVSARLHTSIVAMPRISLSFLNWSV